MKSRPTTIRDVAKEAGVSPSTVSRVLTKSAYVADEKQKRVLAAIKKLDFKPNVVARSLRLKNSRTIGLLIPDITNPFFPEVAKGVEDAAHKSGYNVMLCNTENDPEKEKEYVELLVGRQTDGLIIAKAGEDLDHLKEVIAFGMPITFIDRPVILENCDYVVSDNMAGVRLAVEALHKEGHFEIGFIQGPVKETIVESRWQGFCDGMQECGLDINQEWIFHAPFSVAGGQNAARKLLNLPKHPTAMVCSSDVLAIGFIDVLAEAGFCVPDYMSVIGFDDISFIRYLKPKLTTIWQPKYKMGLKSFELLVSRLKEPKKPSEKIVLDIKFMKRQSHSVPR